MRISVTREPVIRLSNELGLTDEDLHNAHGGGNTSVLCSALDEDMRLTSADWRIHTMRLIFPGMRESLMPMKGVGWKNVEFETTITNV